MKSKTLCLLRHASYERSTMGITPDGARDIVRVCNKLPALDLLPDVIVHSPVLRAQQSAQKAYQALRPHSSTLVLVSEDGFGEARSNNDLPLHKKMMERIGALEDVHETVLVVTHFPNIRMLGDAFLNALISLDTAEMLVLHFDATLWKKIVQIDDLTGEYAVGVYPARDRVRKLSPWNDEI